MDSRQKVAKSLVFYDTSLDRLTYGHLGSLGFPAKLGLPREEFELDISNLIEPAIRMKSAIISPLTYLLWRFCCPCHMSPTYASYLPQDQHL